jgi:hypothetical protein
VALPVPLAFAHVSYSQCIVLALHLAPVRLEVAVLTARNSLFFLSGDVTHRQSDGRIGQIDDDVNLLDIKPRCCEIYTHVRFVLHVAGYDFDFYSFRRCIEILNRKPRCRYSPGEFGIGARHVGQHADLDDTVCILRHGRTARDQSGKQYNLMQSSHVYPAMLLILSCGIARPPWTRGGHTSLSMTGG